MKKYDVIVVGAGHAGIEASFSAAKLGCSVLLLTIDLDDIGKLSCNPAVGGVAKGHLVREVDALGGLIAKIADSASVSYRILNRSKGKAVWATRAQVDKEVYPKIARSFLENQPNIDILQAKVKNILVKKNQVYGIETNFGEGILTKTVVVCAGTFLKSVIHIGLNSFPGGRLYEESSDELFLSLQKLKIPLRHFKTGTCARLDRRTIDFSKMIEQPAEIETPPFSFSNSILPEQQLSCYITHTNKKTHKIILNNLKYSPLYTGKIKSTGVRYCPSLEDKVVRFKDKSGHQVFIEPEGRNSLEVYPNGISTSLPFDVQVDFIHTIPGLEKTKIFRPGYGIEHGVIDARVLTNTLEAKKINGLFFAGQLNGTTGYEEAAAQGFVAGVNAALKVKKRKPFILTRREAFIGVLMDDLTTKGVDEPYRMFTSRCEFRTSLREMNAAFRLLPFTRKLGLLDKSEVEKIEEKNKQVEEELKRLSRIKVCFQGQTKPFAQLLKRPQVSYQDLALYGQEPVKDVYVSGEVETQIKYAGFLHREEIWLKELKNLDKIKLPVIDFSSIPSLSNEIVEKLKKFKPKTLGQALRISGVTPAAILAIHSHFKKHKEKIKR